MGAWTSFWVALTAIIGHLNRTLNVRRRSAQIGKQFENERKAIGHDLLLKALAARRKVRSVILRRTSVLDGGVRKIDDDRSDE